MTFKVRCDCCGKEQTAPTNNIGEPYNPVNPDTRQVWYSATKEGKTFHACCHDHIPDGDPVWPV